MTTFVYCIAIDSLAPIGAIKPGNMFCIVITLAIARNVSAGRKSREERKTRNWIPPDFVGTGMTTSLIY
jgi:hypothetical protein